MVSNILDLLKPKKPLDMQGPLPFDRPTPAQGTENFQEMLKTEISRAENKDFSQPETAFKAPEAKKPATDGQSPEQIRSREDNKTNSSEQAVGKNRTETRDELAATDKKTAGNENTAHGEKKEPVKAALNELKIKPALTPGIEKPREIPRKKTGLQAGAEALAPAIHHVPVLKQNITKPVSMDTPAGNTGEKVLKDTLSRGANAFAFAGIKGREITDRAGNGKQNAVASMVQLQGADVVKNRPVKKEASHDRKEESIAIENKTNLVKSQFATAVNPAAGESESSRPRSDKQHDGQSNFQQQLKGVSGNSQARNANAARETRMPMFQENLDRIMDSARVVVRDGRNASLSMRLNPAELGNVTVNLGLEQGVLTAKFLVDNAEVRDAVAANLEGIRQELEQSGVSVGEFQVNVRDDRAFQKQDETRIFSHFTSSEKREAVDMSYNYTSLPLHEGGINYVI